MKKYLFDFDGTLVDSMPTYSALMLRILDEHGVEYGEDIIKIITPLGYNGTATYFIEKLGMDKSHDYLTSLMLRYAVDAYTNVVSFTLKLEQFIELYKKTQMENKLENIKEDFK